MRPTLRYFQESWFILKEETRLKLESEDRCSGDHCRMSSSRSNRLWHAFQFLALCVLFVVVIEPSGADPESNCKGKVCQKGTKCEPNPCLNGGSCHLLENKAHCTCPAGWTGSDCSEKQECDEDYCPSQPCVHGTCNNGDSTCTCICQAGWTGTKCDIQDYCYSNPCVNGACNDGDSTYTCTCDSGYVGTNCDKQDYCYSRPCVNGACNDGDSTYTCICDSGYVGTNCDKLDFCYSNPCAHGTCNNGDSTYTCTCEAGYVGTNCDKQSGCVSNPCANGGTCYPDDNGGFYCVCDGLWLLPRCEEENGEI